MYEELIAQIGVIYYQVVRLSSYDYLESDYQEYREFLKVVETQRPDIFQKGMIDYFDERILDLAKELSDLKDQLALMIESNKYLYSAIVESKSESESDILFF